MTFREIINDADELYPNAFSLDEKMKFANNLAATLHKKYIKDIKSYEAEGGEDFSLPAGVTADLVCGVYFDDVKQKCVYLASSFRKSEGHRVKIEYIYVPVYTADDELPVSAPFENLFLYYILGFICLHVNDLDGYNANMAIYSTFLSDYEKAFGQNEGEGYRFKNLW